MDKWLRSAIDYIGSWIEFQQTALQQPGVIVAFAHRGEVVAEHAFGLADLDTGEKLTPRHRFRIASHSKNFTSAGIMKLREQRKLRLDDPIGQYVSGLHPRAAETTIAQVLHEPEPDRLDDVLGVGAQEAVAPHDGGHQGHVPLDEGVPGVLTPGRGGPHQVGDR